LESIVFGSFKSGFWLIYVSTRSMQPKKISLYSFFLNLNNLLPLFTLPSLFGYNCVRDSTGDKVVFA
jgi:hypothetical protein